MEIDMIVAPGFIYFVPILVGLGVFFILKFIIQ